MMQASGVDLSKGGEIPELQAFQRHLSDYRIVVYSGQRCDNIMFDGQVATPQRINLLYDDHHYHVITNLTAAIAKRYMCPACNKGRGRGAQHKCDHRVMPVRPFPPASRTMPGSPATSVIDTLETPCASTIISN